MFRKSYRRNQAIDDNKNMLKQKYEAAKDTGRKINQSKEAISKLKASIEQVSHMVMNLFQFVCAAGVVMML